MSVLASPGPQKEQVISMAEKVEANILENGQAMEQVVWRTSFLKHLSRPSWPIYLSNFYPALLQPLRPPQGGLQYRYNKNTIKGHDVI